MRSLRISLNSQLVCVAEVARGGRLLANLTWSGQERYLLVIQREADVPREQDDVGLPFPDICVGDTIQIHCVEHEGITREAPALASRIIRESAATNDRSDESRELCGDKEFIGRGLEMSLNGSVVGTATVYSSDGVLDAYVTWWDTEEPEWELLGLESWEPQRQEEIEDVPLPRLCVGDVVAIRVRNAKRRRAAIEPAPRREK
jgi:hypothetical protein